MNNIERIQNSLLDGGNLVLNFINTINDRIVKEPQDYLTGKEEWIAWLKHVDVFENETSNSVEINFNLKQIIEKREVLHRVFQGLAIQQKIRREDLNSLDEFFQNIRNSTKILIVENTPQEHLTIDLRNLNSYLLKIGQAAHELLFSGETNRIKECGNCGWLFFDASKNKSRKWCNMATCGNEVKARKFYKKNK